MQREKDDVRAKKRLGQHFLNDLEIAGRITSALSPETERVLEIGPGMGVLTRFLLQKKGMQLHAIELDAEKHARFRLPAKSHSPG